MKYRRCYLLEKSWKNYTLLRLAGEVINQPHSGDGILKFLI